MNRSQKIITTSLWIVAVVGTVSLLAFSAMRKAAAPELPTLFDLPQFNLLDQNGSDISDTKLRGRPFISCFVFTNCAGPCPMMFAKMAAMQKTIPNANIKLVSFTVDPERDTPPVLKAKADQLRAQNDRWFFVTGDKDSVHKLMHEMLQPTPDAVDSPLMHDEHFYLFDSAGKCRGRYLSKDDEEMRQLATEAEMLAKMPERK